MPLEFTDLALQLPPTPQSSSSRGYRNPWHRQLVTQAITLPLTDVFVSGRTRFLVLSANVLAPF